MVKVGLEAVDRVVVDPEAADLVEVVRVAASEEEFLALYTVDLEALDRDCLVSKANKGRRPVEMFELPMKSSATL